MRKSIKRFISSVLLSAMLISIIIPSIPLPAEAAEDTLSYWLAKGLPKSALDPLITREMLNETQYKNQLLKTDWGSNLAATTYHNNSFNLNYDGGPRLRYHQQYRHRQDEKTSWYGNFRWEPSQYTKQLIANQELKLYLEASLAADNHNHLINHFGKMLNDRAKIEVTSGGRKLSNLYLGDIINSGSDADEIFYSYDKEFTLDKCDYVNFRMGSTTCGCGSSKVRNVLIALVDEKPPTVKEAKICNTAGQQVDHIPAGDKGIVSLVFSEPMRFADNVAKALTINLDLYGRASEQSIDEKLKASLVSLDKDTLNFEFTVPDKIGGKDTDVYIKSISKEQPNAIFASSGAPFDLVSIVKYDKGTKVSDSIIHANKLSKELGLENIDKAKSAVTDLAGNSVTWTKEVPVNKAYLDGVAPRVEAIDLILSDSKVPTYAGVGSKIGATLFFSETMKFGTSSPSEVKIKLNIGSGQLELKGERAYEVKNGVNRPAVTAIEFKPYEVISATTIDGESVKVLGVSLTKGITDLSGNLVDCYPVAPEVWYLDVKTEGIPQPSQEVKLDVTPPEVTEGRIVGTPSDDGFTYQFGISDSGSGVTGKKGKFAWVNKAKDPNPRFNADGKGFYYVVTSQLEPPDSLDNFARGTISDDKSSIYHYMEFPQMENGIHYLHIRLDDDSDALILDSYLDIVASDLVGNEKAYKGDIEGFKSDATPPVVALGEHYFTTAGTSVNINIPVNANDNFGVSKIYYNWDGGDSFSELIINGNPQWASQNLSTTVTGEVYGEAKLKVYAMDIAENVSSEVSETYRDDISVPRSDLGPNQRDPKDLNFIGPSLYIDTPKATGHFPEATTAIIVRNPFVVFENNIWEHFVYFLDSEDDSLKNGEEYMDFFKRYRNMSESDWDNGDLTGWYSANFYLRETLSDLKLLSSYGFASSKNKPETSKEQFAAIFGDVNLDKSSWHYYGDLEVRVITVAKKLDLTEDNIDLRVFSDSTTLKMRSADPLGIAEEDDPNQTGRLWDGYRFELDEHDKIKTHELFDGKEAHWFRPNINGGDNDYNKNSDLPVTLSLEQANGLKIPFVFNEGHIPSDFQYDDIDEAESSLKLYYTGDQAGGSGFVANEENLVFEAPVYAKEGTQYFSLSINQTNVGSFKTGYYGLVASMATKSKDTNGQPFTRQDLLVSDIFIDTYVPNRDDFVLSLEGTYGGKNKEITSNPGTGQLVGPVGHNMDWRINIGQESTPSQVERNNETYSSYPNSDAYKIGMDDMYWIRVWNPDVEGSEENAHWHHYSKDYKLTFIDRKEDNSLTSYTAYDNGTAYAPVIKGEKNTMIYEFSSYNGLASPRGQFTLLAGKEEPSFELWSSHKAGTPAKSILIGPTDIKTDNLIEGYGLLIKDGGVWRPVNETEAEAFSYEEIDEDDNTRTIETMNFEVFINGDYKYHIYDEYGMVGEEEIEITDIDSQKPSIEISDKKFEDGALKFTATVTDDYSLDGGYLLVNFAGPFVKDSHLEKLDKVDGSENSDVYISIPLSLGDISKDDFRKAGIYNLNIDDANDGKTKTVSIEMLIGNVPEGSPSYIYLDARDKVGNVYDDSSAEVLRFTEGKEYAPAIIDAKWDEGQSMVYLNFNTPVRLISYGLANSDYGSSLPTTISANGTHTIEYTDIFGDIYSRVVEIDLDALNLGLDIHLSTTAPTNKDIELTLKTSDKNVTITKVKIGINPETDLPLNTLEHNITIENNTTVQVTVKNASGDTRTQAIAIDNIDKIINTPSLHWSFEGDKDDTLKTTDGFVSVTVVGDEPLFGDLTHTFTHGATKDTKHTLTYSDEAGNTGSIEASLAYNIIIPTSFEDKLAPGVDINVYFKTFEVYKQGPSGSAGNFSLSNTNDVPPEGLGEYPPDYSKDTGSPINWSGEKLNDQDQDNLNIRSQAVRMDLKITDHSPTKIFIKSTKNPPKYASGAIDSIENVKLSDNSILIDTTENKDTTPQDFYIFVVDEKDNWTSFLVKPGLLDKTPPKTEISTKQHSPFIGEAILKIAEEDVRYTTVTNKAGLIKYDDGTYGYMTGKNETVTFYYHDSVGNSGEKTAKIGDLDEYAPEVIGLTWSPQGIDGDTPGIQNPPSQLMKGSLLAQLTIKNQFSSVKLINNGNKDVKLSFTDRKINLIFNENAEVDLEISSPNGKILERSLSVSCLDNEKLVITKSEPVVAKNKRSASLTFTPNKDNVYFVEGRQYRDNGQDFDPYTVSSAKPIDLNFTDKVGNVHKEKVDLSDKLDFIPLKLSFNTEDKDEGAVYKLSDLYENSTGDNLAVYVKSSHKVDVEGANITSLTANKWTPLTLTKVDNKASLKFTDDRGDTFATAAYFKVPDKTPPTILLKDTVISVAKDIATKEVLEDLIEKSVMVSDNVSKVDDIKLTINTDNVKLSVLGLYTASITAQDEADNKSSKDIQVRVGPAEGLLAQIGSRFLEPSGTHILYGDSLTFSLLTQDRSPVAEPYKIYVKEDLQTPGQMKSAKRFYSDEENTEQTINFESKGLHTIYIQTQNRYNYIFYVYVMD